MLQCHRFRVPSSWPMSQPLQEQPTAAAADVNKIRTASLKIRRYDPEVGPEANWQTYQVPVEAGDRVLDALHQIKWYQDGPLSFRRSCAHGVCGSDAMRINGVNRLACKVLMKDLAGHDGDEILIEPINGLPALKDLIVDVEPFFDAFRSMKPFLLTDGREPTRERLQSAKERERFDDTTKSILCAACTASCPVYWVDDTYFGPQAIVAAHTDSSSTAATTASRNAWRSSTPSKASGDAEPRSTAPMPAHAASRSPKRSARSSEALIFRR
ncbi:MAG: succinate dehydrogenase iron-sulfur subunit [Nocardioides sp.]|nr:succinate dehydrogenase iron-sulfur subunit [Nocardioides sp.]